MIGDEESARVDSSGAEAAPAQASSLAAASPPAQASADDGAPAPMGAFAPDAASERRLMRWAACVALLPIPLAFIISAALAPAPAWRAEYHANRDFTGAQTVLAERELQRYWDKHNPRVSDAIDARTFSARWDTCLALETARDIPIMLVSDGTASFRIDGTERLSASGTRARVTRGEVLRLEPGSHHLEVSLRPRGWPSIALLASFDGRPPIPLGSGQLAAGVRSYAPREGDEPCPSR